MGCILLLRDVLGDAVAVPVPCLGCEHAVTWWFVIECCARHFARHLHFIFVIHKSVVIASARAITASTK
jgi:hypothetical protein